MRWALILLTAISVSAQVTWSNNVSMSNNVVAGNASLLPYYGISLTSMRIQSDVQLSNFYQNATVNMWQWRTNNGVTNLKNTHCWVASMDLTGYTFISGSLSSRNVAMITPNWGVSCKHSPPSIGDTIVFSDINGVFQTNGVKALIPNPTNDIELCQLSNTLPTTVHPFHLMPNNWRIYSPFGGNDLVNPVTGFDETFQALWFRPNGATGTQGWTMNAMVFISDEDPTDTGSVFCATTACDSLLGWTTPVTDANATGGDSSGGVWMLIHNVPVLLFTAHSPNGSGVTGPLVSDSIPWIQGQITDPLSFAWMGGFTPY